jgi:hypothetical protein
VHDRASFPQGIPQPPHTQHSTVDLRLDHSGKDWKLSWNTDHGLLSRASRAELLIGDGSHQVKQLLTPAQIRAGNILYSPVSEDVVFHLQAYDSANNTVGETLRVVHSGPVTPPGALQQPEEKVITRWRERRPEPGASQATVDATIMPSCRPELGGGVANNSGHDGNLSSVGPQAVCTPLASTESPHPTAPARSALRAKPDEDEVPLVLPAASSASPGQADVVHGFKKITRKFTGIFHRKPRNGSRPQGQRQARECDKSLWGHDRTPVMVAACGAPS